MKQLVILISFLIPVCTFAVINPLLRCSDTAYISTTIDSLKIGSRYYIIVESSGCFHNTKLNLTISRNDVGYFATFKMSGKIEGKKVNQEYPKTRLNQTQLDSLRIFEKKLIDISKQKLNCTTIDSYTLNHGNVSNRYKDDTCNWEGIRKVVAILFRKRE